MAASTKFNELLKNRTNITKDSVKNSINKINAIDNGQNFNFVMIDEMMPSELNDFEIEDYTSLKESIKNYGLIHNLLLLPIDDNPQGYKYKILSGERRYHAIKELIEEGDTQFNNGIMSKIADKNISITEQEILIRIANIEQRGYEPKVKRENVEKLIKLYQVLNEEKGIKKSVTKQVAESIGMDQRQVQRYNSLNNLIPELKERFDNSTIAVEKASQFASLDEETQRLVVELLDKNSSITKKEVLEIQSRQKEMEQKNHDTLNSLTAKLVQAEQEKDNIKTILSQKEKEVEEIIRNKEKEFEEAISEKDSYISHMLEQEKTKREELQEALSKATPNDDEIDKLKKELENLTTEKETAIKEVEELKNQELEKAIKELEEQKKKDIENKTRELDLKNKELQSLKKELEDIKKSKENSQKNIEVEIRYKTEITSLLENSYKGVSTALDKIKEMQKNGISLDLQESLTNLKSLLNNFDSLIE